MDLQNHVLIDFSLTVKMATLIFISGRGSAILSAKQGISGCLGRVNVRVFMKIQTVYKMNSHLLISINPQSA